MVNDALKFSANKIHMAFDIRKDFTYVSSIVSYQGPDSATTLVLKAINPNLSGHQYIKSVIVNGEECVAHIDHPDVKEGRKPYYNYNEKDQTLSIPLKQPGLIKIKDAWEVQILTRVEPQNNTQHLGLYKEGKRIKSDCLGNGFYRITPFLDCPEKAFLFIVAVETDKKGKETIYCKGDDVMSYEPAEDRCTTLFINDAPISFREFYVEARCSNKGLPSRKVNKALDFTS